MATPSRAQGTLSDRALRGLLLALGALVLAYYALLWPFLPESFTRPGAPWNQLLGALGSLLLLLSIVFSAVKRSPRSAAQKRWHHIHMVGGSLGVALVAIHSDGRLGRAPALLLLVLLTLLILGIYGRLLMGELAGRAFGTRWDAFAPLPAVDKKALGGVIAAKRALLPRIEAGAEEGLFGLRVEHWVRKPVLSLRYWRLVRRERALVGITATAPLTQGYWRAAHLFLASLFLLGLLGHVVTTLFFPAYVAGDRDIYWFHLRR